MASSSSSPSKTFSHPTVSYPETMQSNPEAASAVSPSSSTLYPSLDHGVAAEELFYESENAVSDPEFLPSSSEIVLVMMPGAVVHMIEPENSFEIASGVLSVVSLEQDENVVSIIVRVGEIQWPLARDERTVKLDDGRYFFTLRVPAGAGEPGDVELLNYGLTIVAKGQEGLIQELDRVLEQYSCFSIQKVKEMDSWESVAREISPKELEMAPNVNDYSGRAAKLIATGSGQLIRGILWFGDVTVDRLKRGNEFLSRRLGQSEGSEINPAIMRMIKGVKRVAKISEKAATGILSGVVKVSGLLTGSIVNSWLGKKFFSFLPGEVLLALLDGFAKVCDAIEVAGKNVMSTTSVVTTGLVSQRYGEQAGQATSHGLDAVGHVIGTAWVVFKIRNAFNPKSVMNRTTLAIAAAKAKSSEIKSKGKKKHS